jgi:aldose 1-epimerase
MNKISTGLLFLTVLSLMVSCSERSNSNKASDMKEQASVTASPFGTIDNQDIQLYTLTNTRGMIVKLTNYGGIVTSIKVPDKNGNLGEVTLGFDNLDAYLKGHPYFGCIVGRYGNRIASGTFQLDDVAYTLARNNDGNSLHGGESGFDKKIWDAKQFNSERGAGVQLHYLSPDMEEGYPGNLDVFITYLLTNDNELMITYKATTDKATPVNLTFHGYFNFTGGQTDVLDHQIMINADRYVVVDESLIPTGELRLCDGTPMDFRTMQPIGDRINLVEGGYDHTYVVNRDHDGLVLVARVYESMTGRWMEVHSTEPGVQFYTGNFLDGTLSGWNDVVYEKHYGFCLETQHFPDSPNQPGFPNTILRPGETYAQSTMYKFGTKTD